MEFDSSQAFSKSPNTFSGQLVTCDPQDLRPHPSYARHGLGVPANRLSALRARRDLAFEEPLTITRDRIIIDGYARWELAKESKLPILHCIEYDLSETEALEWLLQRHRRSSGLNAYSRIMLALDIEPEVSEKARRNRQIGGQQKDWSNLTKAEQVHVRSEIAKAAAVSTGNVTKVKQLNQTCAPGLVTALYNDEESSTGHGNSGMSSLKINWLRWAVFALRGGCWKTCDGSPLAGRRLVQQHHKMRMIC